MPNYLLAVAPMLDYTDRHCRYFLRLLSRRITLYTEMVTTGAVLYGKNRVFLDYDSSEHPVILQLAGCDPEALAQCASVGETLGYDAINLNVGCPSDRVQAARLGACLMAEPDLVAACVAAMKREVHIPITVKTRIGIDEQDSYEHLAHFIQTVAAAGCDCFILHARKAYLKGLNPKENREIPPLRYEVVYQIKRDFPNLKIVINGGINDLEQAQAHLVHVDGVMIGRAFYNEPYSFAETDQIVYGATHPVLTRHELLEQYFEYVEKQLALGVRLAPLVRPVLNLFQGIPGARAWRRCLSEHMPRVGAGIEVLKTAMEKVR
jgi:tRNA-dihydrouridine synthase A